MPETKNCAWTKICSGLVPMHVTIAWISGHAVDLRNHKLKLYM